MTRTLDSLDTPWQAQCECLRKILTLNAETDYGRLHDFASIDAPDTYTQRVPVVGYDDLSPYIDAIADGQQGGLLAEEVVYLGLSSGTSGGRKFIPITESYEADFREWMATEEHYIRKCHPDLVLEPHLRYINRVEGALDSGLPFGAVSAWYYSYLVREGLYKEPVPFEVFQLEGIRRRSYAILRWSLQVQPRRLTAVNPSSLLLLAQLLAEFSEPLIRDVRDGTLTHPEIPDDEAARLGAGLRPDPQMADRLEAALARDGSLMPKGAWPDLNLLSCWKQAGAGLYMGDIDDVFGGVPVWDYGQTSTEGRVAIAMNESGLGLPLLHSAFLELRDDTGRIQPLVKAQTGTEGELIVTNFRGLYRYSSGDRVRLEGKEGATPLMRFMRKSAATASLTGEKLTESEVNTAVTRVLTELSLRTTFFCLCPVWGRPPHYELLLEPQAPDAEVDAQRFAARLEDELRAQNTEYTRKRDTLRLAAPTVRVLPVGSLESYIQRQEQLGRERTRIKIPRVSMDLGFAESFA